MLDRDQLEAFAAVLKFRSFGRAANHLSLTRGAISQRVRALEESVSKVLIVRGKPISATTHGEHLLRHVQALRVMEAETLIAIGNERQASKAIRIALGCDADSISTWFPYVLPDVARLMAVSFDLVVELPATMMDMLRRGELLGCVSSSLTAPKGFSSDPLGALRYTCVATPGLASRIFSNGFELKQALSTYAILIRQGENIHDGFLCDMFGFSVENYPQHCFPTPEARLKAICSGIGYGFAPELQVGTLIQKGELVDLLPGKIFDIELYWHQSIVESALHKQVRMHVNHRAAEHLKRMQAS